MKVMLKAPGTNRLQPKYDQLLSRFAFNSNLRRYNKEPGAAQLAADLEYFTNIVAALALEPPASLCTYMVGARTHTPTPTPPRRCAPTSWGRPRVNTRAVGASHSMPVCVWDGEWVCVNVCVCVMPGV
jgi:hypothetical protein